MNWKKVVGYVFRAKDAWSLWRAEKNASKDRARRRKEPADELTKGGKRPEEHIFPPMKGK